jgi:hypothetical protein
MKHVCTVSDINYLIKGLTLYESLKKNTEDFMLHYLCIDEKSYNKVKHYESNSLKAYNVENFLEVDTKLKALKTNEYRYFCWSLASYFTNKLLQSDLEAITYIDADIYFHKSFDIILDEIGDREIGMFRHRQFPLTTPRPEGHYNVGVIHFKKANSGIGKGLCAWWSDSVLNKKHPEYATCGDQKYLEYFVVGCPPELLYIDENIGHGAPWHWQTFEFLGDGKIKFGGQEQELVFTHFSQFEDGEDTYIPSTMHHIYTPLSMYKNNKELKAIYDEYHSELARVKLDYNGPQ